MRKAVSSKAPDCQVKKYVGTSFDEVKIVADNIEDVITVADNITKIDDVMPHVGNIATVANNIDDVNTVADNIADVNTVASIAPKVSNVSDNMASVVNTSDNMAAVIDAPNQAAAAKASADAALVSETNAKTSETNAKLSETNASTSEQNAAASAQAAQASASAASASEQAASTSETNAKQSELNAATSAANALASEQAAKASETNAALSETNAANSATAAANSATAAATSETNASISEGNAKTSEINAAASEQVAITKAAEASASAANAAASEASALQSKTDAEAAKLAAQDAQQKSETIYEAFMKGAVYRGGWNPEQTQAYPDPLGTNSQWDVWLAPTTPYFDFDGKRWYSGDRLIWSQPDMEFFHITRVAGVLSVNGKTGAVNLTAEDFNAIDSIPNIVPDVDALFAANKHVIDYTNSSVPGLAGQRSLLHIQNGIGGFQLAARSTGSEYHVRTANSGDGTIYPWERLYTTGYKPTPADIGAATDDASPTWYQTGLTKGTNLYRAVGRTSNSESADWDNITDAGIYARLLNNTSTNGPVGGTGYHYLENFTYGSTGNTTQLAIPYGVGNNNGRIALRSKYNNVWNPWEYLYTTRNKPTATDVGALPITGGTVTGILGVGSSKFLMEGVNMMGASDTVTRFGDATHARTLYLNAKDGDVSVSNGSNTFRVYHAGYKPHPSDVGGVVSQAGQQSSSPTYTKICSLPINPGSGGSYASGYITGGQSYGTNTTPNMFFSASTRSLSNGAAKLELHSTFNISASTELLSCLNTASNTTDIWLKMENYAQEVKILRMSSTQCTWHAQNSTSTAPSNIVSRRPVITLYSASHKPTPNDINAVNKAGDTMTGVLQINGLHSVDAVAADAIKMSGYGVMANRSVMYVHNANSAGKISFGIGGNHGQNVKAEISSSGILSAVPVTVAHDVAITPNTGDASLNMSTAANRQCTIRMREDANKHGAFIQYRGLDQNDLIFGTYQNGVATNAISIPRGNQDVNFEKNIGVKGGLINLASKHRIVGETNGVKLQNVANGKNGWFGARNADWFHIETDTTNGFYSYDNFNIPNLTVRAGLSAVTVGASGTGTSQGFVFNGKTVIGGANDGWIRMNPTGQFQSGIYCGGVGLLRHDFAVSAGDATSATVKSSALKASFYDGSWSGDGVAAVSVKQPDTNGAHWALASYYNANNIRAGIQILSNTDGRMRFYTNRRASYVEVQGGSLIAQGNVTAYSDARVKADLEVIPDALDKVSKLTGYTYKRTDRNDEGRKTGLIAQDVEKVLPEAVTTVEREDIGIEDFKTVDYGNMVGLLVEAIKELKEQNQNLTKRIEELENGIA
ncbi:long tail fiber distal subunit [Vibrio phage PhiImVa-1]|nr:long tail fiber distal subunit [Vibrio phage PhiImVa-1]